MEDLELRYRYGGRVGQPCGVFRAKGSDYVS